MRIVDNDSMQIEKTKQKITSDDCESCHRNIEQGSYKYRWRMRIEADHFFHHGSFWCVQCAECFNRTLVNWDNEINEARNIIA